MRGNGMTTSSLILTALVWREMAAEATYIDHPSAEGYVGVPRFHGAALDGWKNVIDTVHAAGGKMFPQLWHVGSFRQLGMPPEKWMPSV